ncbi:MAG TPA: hypothetical protein VGB79_17405 [Allosphingosinicella sp.]|jgi:hypothetical protein
MHRSLLGILALAGLAAPACAQPQASCAAPPAGWVRYDPGHAPEHRIRLSAILRADGSVAWHGAAISEERLIAYLARTRSMNPAPYIVLGREPGADCRRLRHLRALFETHAGCGGSGVCSEVPAP